MLVSYGQCFCQSRVIPCFTWPNTRRRIYPTHLPDCVRDGLTFHSTALTKMDWGPSRESRHLTHLPLPALKSHWSPVSKRVPTDAIGVGRSQSLMLSQIYWSARPALHLSRIAIRVQFRQYAIQACPLRLYSQFGWDLLGSLSRMTQDLFFQTRTADGELRFLLSAYARSFHQKTA